MYDSKYSKQRLDTCFTLSVHNLDASHPEKRSTKSPNCFTLKIILQWQTVRDIKTTQEPYDFRISSYLDLKSHA